METLTRDATSEAQSIGGESRLDQGTCAEAKARGAEAETEQREASGVRRPAALSKAAEAAALQTLRDSGTTSTTRRRRFLHGLRGARRIEHIELIAGVAATLVVIGLHVRYLMYAGALWRDEAGGVQLARLPSIAETWRKLGHDSFPALFPLLVRAWSTCGLGGTDFQLRLLGFGIGLGLLGVLWLNARLAGGRVPWVGLGLLGTNLTLLRWGDGLRAYGLGCLCIALTVGLIWHLVRAPSRKAFFFAAAAACLSVQSLYQNAFLVLAVCLAGAAACAWRRDLRSAGVIIGVGFVAALSLLPYYKILVEAQNWVIIAKIGFVPERIWDNFKSCLANGRDWQVGIWLMLTAATLIVGWIASGPGRVSLESPKERAVFTAAGILIAIPAFLAFLYLAALPTEPWYFLSFIVFIAAILETAVAGWRQSFKLGWVGLAIVIFGLMAADTWKALRCRQTNLDLVAQDITHRSAPGDLIVVYPCHCGITFARYYSGPVAWMTLPPISDYRFHRYDLVRQQLAAPAPIEPVFEAAQRALAEGHRLWIVGELPWPKAGAVDRSLPPPAPRAGASMPWREDWYDYEWARKLAFWVRVHAQQIKFLPAVSSDNVSSYENLPLVETSGWR